MNSSKKPDDPGGTVIFAIEPNKLKYYTSNLLLSIKNDQLK